MSNTPLTVRASVRLADLPLEKQIQIFDRLFIRLTSIYGARWSAQFKTEAQSMAMRAEWRLHLQTKTIAQISKAVNDCVTCYRDFPPTLGQFEALCKLRHGPYLGASSPAKDQPALSNVAPKPMTREEAMRSMKEILGMMGKSPTIN